MRILVGLVLFPAIFFACSNAATNYELEAKKFIDGASTRYYNLYNKIAEETYSSLDDEDFEAMFSKLTTVKKIANDLVEISQEASEFDQAKIEDVNIKRALQSLRMTGQMFVLGEDYFSSVLINIVALKQLSTDKDIEPYLGGANMPDQDDSPLAYYPDIQKIFQHSNDSDELKYYWETSREKNLLWSSVNFYTMIESIRNASVLLEIPVLEFWYRYYENKDFITEMEKVMQDIKPAYQQLHAFVRQELHKKYGDIVDPNGPIPDHIFQQVLEQVWKKDNVIEEYFPFKEVPPYDKFVEKFTARQMIDEAERFYTSLGFQNLEASFWKDQLKEHDESGNTGDCRADIFDLTPHVYMKYCQQVDFRKFLQTHGYIGRVHYAKEKKQLPAYFFNSYDLEYPVGEAIILSASTPKHLSAIGLAENYVFTEKTLNNRLFRMGMHTILNIPQFFVYNKVMNDLLVGTIQIETANSHYWKLMQEYAGVEPPTDREEGALDFPFKFYMDIEDNHQTKKFVSEILGYQFYRAFCKKSAQQGPLHNCDFYGNAAIGNDLRAMMSMGSTKSWREVLAKVLPDNHLSGQALLEYYAPILDWLKTKNTETKVKIGWNNSKKKVI